MFTSFDEEKFWQAIKDKDKNTLKIDTVSAIRNDPTFSRDEVNEILKTLDENIPEIFEDEITLEYEERLGHSEWDKAYFSKLTFWFQENFAKSRLQHIKEVGHVVHKDTAEKYAESMAKKNAPQNGYLGEHSKKYKNPTKASGRKVNPKVVFGGIAAIAALTLIVVLLVKK